MRASSFRPALFAPFAAALLLAATPACADDDQTAHLKDLLRSTTIALRDAQDENAALNAKESALQAQVTSLQQELVAAQAKASNTAAASGQVAQAQQAVGQYQAQIDKDQETLGKWEAAYKQAADVARSRDAAAKDFSLRYSQSSMGLKACTSKNADLETLANDIIDRLQKRCSFGEFFGRHEPITQIYRVKLENIIQAYQDKLAADRVASSQVAGAPN